MKYILLLTFFISWAGCFRPQAVVQQGLWLEIAALSVLFSDSKQQLCEMTWQLKWDKAGGPGAACAKAFVAYAGAH